MDVFAWVLTGVLASVFLVAGALKALSPYPKLLENPGMQWATDFEPSQVKAIAALEIIGAAGLVLPWAFDTAKVLTPLAAIGLAVIMAGAILTHARRSEWPPAGVNVALLAIAVAIAALRFGQL